MTHLWQEVLVLRGQQRTTRSPAALFAVMALTLLTVLVQARGQQTVERCANGTPLLDPLRFADGRAVRSPAEWPRRRAELVRMFEETEFGKRPPGAAAALRWHVDEVSGDALGGQALRKQITLFFPEPSPEVLTRFPHAARSMRLVLYLPKHVPRGRSPVVLGGDFIGPWGIAQDPGVPLGTRWPGPRSAPLTFADAMAAAEKERGASAARWQVPKLLERGYGVASFYYGDLEPDNNGGWQFGVRPLFFHPGQTAPAAGEWGALSVWAWGLSRAMDYLQNDPDVDAAHVAVFGHSRLGKAAAWASALDPRFWALLSNEAGKAGDSLVRCGTGEPNSFLWKTFPFWFTPAFAQWVGHDAEMPVDGNLLLSLTAPRPLHVGAAQGDAWSDPTSEELSVRSAARVYAFLAEGKMSGVAAPRARPGFHLRNGVHNVTAEDWDNYLAFLDAQLQR